MSKYYIYKYVQDNEIVYIGQTVNLKRRIAQHKADKLKNIQADIYFFECDNQTAMNSWEYCLINKYHPKYNVSLNNLETSININEPNWILYQSDSLSLSNTIDKKDPVNKKSHKIYNINLNALDILIEKPFDNSTFIYNFNNISMLEQRLMLYLLVKSKLKNKNITQVKGSVQEYAKFLNLNLSNPYEYIQNILQQSFCLFEEEKNNFKLTQEGIKQLNLFKELDIETLISIIKNTQNKYTCFILNLLMQTDDYILYFDKIYSYLPPSYKKYDHLKNRILLPVIEDLKLSGFDFKYNPLKTGRKYTHISFI